MLELFKFNSNQVRVIILCGEMWVVAMDVAKILDYDHCPHMLDLVDKEDKQIINPQKLDCLKIRQSFSSNTFKVSIINESGLYACIFGSTKPEAKTFKKWVTSELLPTIRKTGSYSVSQIKTPQTYIEALRALLTSEEEKELLKLEKQLLEQDNTVLATAVDELFNYSSILRVAKFNDVSETEFQWRRLKAVSQQLGLEVKKVPSPRYANGMNLYPHDAWRVAYPDVDLPETTTLKVYRN